MNKKRKKTVPEWVLFLGAVLLLGLFGWFTIQKTFLVNPSLVKQDAVQQNPKTHQKELRIGSAKLMAEVRQTPEEQALGLSWRKNMGENEGMVFIYKEPERVLYWMKGMQFSLDFILVSESKVVEIIPNISHPTLENPVIETVSPKDKVDMVIEVHAGWAEKNNIKIGDDITL